MSIEFNGQIKSRDITLSDIKQNMTSLQIVWDYVNKNIDINDPVREDFSRILMRATERIADVADTKGFDDINELEELLTDRDIISFILH